MKKTLQEEDNDIPTQDQNDFSLRLRKEIGDTRITNKPKDGE